MAVGTATTKRRRRHDRKKMNHNGAPNGPAGPDAVELQHRLRRAAHDIRSLLGPIVGFAELIAMSDDIEQCRLHAAKISEASLRLEELADSLADRVLDRRSDDPGGHLSSADSDSGSS